MSEIQLVQHVQEYNTIKFRGEVYTYDKKTRKFTSKPGNTMSLDYAISHCDEITEGWKPEAR